MTCSGFRFKQTALVLPIHLLLAFALATWKETDHAVAIFVVCGTAQLAALLLFENYIEPPAPNTLRKRTSPVRRQPPRKAKGATE